MTVVGPHPPEGPFDPRTFARAVSAYAQRWRLFTGCDRALLMVSGGQDSVALLHLVASGALGAAGPRDLHALHVNHGLRGAASESDQELVEALCSRLGVGLTVWPGPIEPVGGNRQERARDVRRSTAEVVATGIGAACVVLGHTLDDQAETILYRAGRYGGLAAVTGMRPRDGAFVRPLLARRRWETAAYCETLGVAFARDVGNEDPVYARTAIRREVVPAWERCLPGAVESLGRLSETAAETGDVLSGLYTAVAAFVCPGGSTRVPAAPEWPAAAEAASPAVELSASRLRRVPRTLRRAFLHRWLLGVGRSTVTRARILAVDDLAGRPGSGEVPLGGGRWVRKEYDRLLLTGTQSRGCAGETRVRETVVPLRVPGVAEWDGLLLVAEVGTPVRAHDPRSEAYLDARAIDGPVSVRGSRPGDRVQPLGGPGHRSLQDVLVDMRVPRRARARVPVVVCGERILWVVGLTLAEGGRIRRDTDRVVRLSVEPAGAAEGQARVRTHDRGAT